jgi:hypothetical protein
MSTCMSSFDLNEILPIDKVYLVYLVFFNVCKRSILFVFVWPCSLQNTVFVSAWYTHISHLRF